MGALSIIICALLAYSLLSRRLESLLVTGPIFFAGAGVAAALSDFVRVPGGPEMYEPFMEISEVGLVLLLFADASRTELGLLRRIGSLPTRLLSVGLLLTILLGAVAAKVVFPELSIWEAGIIGAILAPTDAGLGQVIVNSPKVSEKIRQALNVEAGLNDGLAVPFLLFFMTMALPAGTMRHSGLTMLIVEQLGYGAAVGVGIGLAGGWLLGLAHRREWMAEAMAPLGLMTLPLLCATASPAVNASMFIAAFVAGLVVQIGRADSGKHSIELTEQWGQIFALGVFFIFGFRFAVRWGEFGWRAVIYAAASLTVVRMLPVAIALMGTKLDRATVLFVGWFGPRGMASIVLGLVFLQEVEAANSPHADAIRQAVMVTVMMSIIAHGISAMPGINLLARSGKAAQERPAI